MSRFVVVATVCLTILTGCVSTQKQEAKVAEPETKVFKLYPIGHVEKKDGRSFIVIDPRYKDGLLGLDKQAWVHVIYWFDRNDNPRGRSVLQVNPRADSSNPLTGVFATHSPFRPNLIAISRCDIVSVKDNVIEVKDIDAFDGSPVIDLKGDFFAFYKPEK